MGGTRWTTEQLKVLDLKYPSEDLQELSKQLNKAVKSIYHKANQQGLKRLENVSHKNLVLYGSKTRFLKGGIPFNKGTKGIMKANKTSFSKGHIPHNTKHFGKPYLYSRTRKNGCVENIWWIGLGEGRRVPYLRYLWESVHGKLDKGMLVTCIGENILDRVPVISELTTITRVESVRKNSGSDELSKGFVSGTLKRQGITQPSQELINLKREYLKITRKINEHEEDNRSDSD